MKAAESRRTIAHDPDALGDVETLLGRYPDVTRAERDRIGAFLRRGAPIDIGLLSSNGRLWDSAERFRSENPAYFKLGASVYAWWVLAAGAIGAGLFFMKDLGLN